MNPDLPLIDLHRHLDGNVRIQTILDLGHKHNLSLPAWDEEGLRPHIQVTTPQAGVMAFIEKFKWMTGILVDQHACRRVAYENVQDAQQEGLDYVELRFSPWFMAEPHNLRTDAVVEAVVDGVRTARRDCGMRVNLIGILSRTYGPEDANQELQALLSQRENLVGLDLAGDEVGYPGGLFIEHFKRARDAGWHITVHAGEAAGPDSIWQAVLELGAERIGHAVCAMQDPNLVEMLAERRIGLECSLTSNVQTSTVADYASHPMKKFLELGLLATINTDDPGISGIDLLYEYQVAAPAAGLSADQISQAQRNALEVAFLSPSEKQILLETKS